MGKYIKKEKASSSSSEAGDLSPIELTQSSSLGVRTRAKTLALQRLQKSDGSYLQLRSRTLVKSAGDSKRRPKGNPNSRLLKVNSGSDGLGSPPAKKIDGGGNGDDNCGAEASFGENVLELQGRDRSTRENTPCSLTRDPESVRTPGSTTKPAARSTEANRQVQNSTRRNVPTSCDMDEFFSGPEKQQQEQFMEKYNFDPMNERPLPGRYEWVKLDDQ